MPAKAGRIFGYLKYLRIPDGMRPVMRNYTVREFRVEGLSGGRELDIDFVLHGSGPEAGPASRWAESCTPGESVVIIDEGLGFNPERGTSRVLLVADETGLPAVAGVCASLPEDATGVAILEVPSEDDALTFRYPSGIDIQWVVREDGAGWLSTVVFATAPFASVAFTGLWLMPATIALRLLERPLAGILTGVISGLVAFLYLPGAIGWALFAEIAFLLTLYRTWRIWVYYASSLLAGALYPIIGFEVFNLGTMAPGTVVAFFALTIGSCLVGTTLGLAIAQRLRRAGVGRLARRRPDQLKSATRSAFESRE